MDTSKAQKLLLKIQAFLEHDPNQSLSRLEKDLLKTYLIQLYDVVSDENELPGNEIKSGKSEPVRIAQEYQHEVKPPVQERVVQPVYTPETIVPPAPVVQPVDTKPAEIIVEKEEVRERPVYVEIPKVEEPPKVSMKVEEVVKEVPVPRVLVKDPGHSAGQEALERLFAEQMNDNSATHGAAHVQISSIESALGLNDRIFTLNELFGGDRVLFDITCQKLNELHSFAEAKELLLNGAAQTFRWGDLERIKMAENFIRIVARRYPKS